MRIQGLQKLTLLDYPGKMACTVFLDGCNFRCPFCHNGDLALSRQEFPAFTPEDLLAFLRKRSGVLDGVCITGGEPLLSTGLDELLRQIRALGYQIKLDTNGSLPDRLRELTEAGLVDYVAMDIKNSKQRYAETAGLPSLDCTAIDESVRFLLSGAVEYEFRTTVVREYHTAADFESIGQWIRGAKRYYLQAFVDSDRVLCGGLHGYDRSQMEHFQQILIRAGIPAQIRGMD